MIGTVLGQYRIVEKIGEGGMGVVYLADDLRLERQVAVKVLPDTIAGDRERRERLIREARAAAALEHPHICAIHDAGEADGLAYVAMEYVRGRSLRQMIAAGPLPIATAIDLAIQIADGLAAAHARSLVHRDLKPENVLVTDEGHAKIIDFGLAIAEPIVDGGAATILPTVEPARDARIAGTLAYMSPEQARGEQVDARSDIFSFGVVLHEMILGASPFRRPSAAETLSAILNDPAPQLVGRASSAPTPGWRGSSSAPPDDLQRIVRKLLVKDRNARYQSIKDVAVDLRELRASGVGTTTTSVGAELAPASAPGVIEGASARLAEALGARRRRPDVTSRGGPSKLGPYTYTAAVGAIVVAAIAWWLVAGRRAPEPRGIGASGRPAIAVMGFENPSGATDIAWLTKGVPAMLITGLAQTRGLDVVSSTRLDEVIKAAGYGDLDRLDKSRWMEVARRAGAGAIVTGSVFRAGSDLRFDVSVEEASSGRVVLAHSVRGPDVFPLVDDLASRIVREMRTGDPRQARPVADVTSPSLEAYRLYTEGAEARRNVRVADARALLEKAVAIDPAFATAYAELAAAASMVGDLASAQKYRKLAWDNQDRLPPRDRLLIELETARTEGDSSKAVGVGERLVEEFPGELEGYHMLSHAYQDTNQVDRALRAMEAATRIAPDAGNLHNEYGYLLLQSGRHAEALRQFEEYVRVSPREPNAQDSLAEAHLILGDPEKALGIYDTAFRVHPGLYDLYHGRAWTFAMLGRYDEAIADSEAWVEGWVKASVPTTQPYLMKAYLLSRAGRYREMVAALAVARQEAKRSGNVEGDAGSDLIEATVALEQKRHDAAIAAADRVVALTPKIRGRARGMIRASGQLIGGTAEARSGRIAAARSRLDRARADMDAASRTERWLTGALAGEIALAAGASADALAAMRAADPEAALSFSIGNGMLVVLPNTMPMFDGLARALATSGEPAVDALRAAVTPKGRKWAAPLEPRFVLALARALEPADKAASIAEYERFLKLWSRADEGAPELAEARRKVAARNARD